MSTYPDYGIAYGSSPEPDSGIRTEITKAGTLRSTRTFTQTVHTLTLNHPYLSEHEAQAIEAFYTANATAEFFYAYPFGTSSNETYRVRFKDAPEIVRQGPEYFTASVTLIGHKQ